MSVDTNVWRIVVLFVGAVLIFYADMVFLAVLVGWMKVSSYNRKLHVLSIAASYIGLASALWLQIAGRALQHAPVTWRLWFGTIAFPLGIYALLMLTGFGRRQRITGGLAVAQRGSKRTEKMTKVAHEAAADALDEINLAIDKMAEDEKDEKKNGS